MFDFLGNSQQGQQQGQQWGQSTSPGYPSNNQPNSPTTKQPIPAYDPFACIDPTRKSPVKHKPYQFHPPQNSVAQPEIVVPVQPQPKMDFRSFMSEPDPILSNQSPSNDFTGQYTAGSSQNGADLFRQTDVKNSIFDSPNNQSTFTQQKTGFSDFGSQPQSPQHFPSFSNTPQQSTSNQDFTPSFDAFNTQSQNAPNTIDFFGQATPKSEPFTAFDQPQQGSSIPKAKSTNWIEPKGQFPQEPTKSLSTSFSQSTAVDFSPTFPSFDDTTAATTAPTVSFNVFDSKPHSKSSSAEFSPFSDFGSAKPSDTLSPSFSPFDQPKTNSSSGLPNQSPDVFAANTLQFPPDQSHPTSSSASGATFAPKPNSSSGFPDFSQSTSTTPATDVFGFPTKEPSNSGLPAFEENQKPPPTDVFSSPTSKTVDVFGRETSSGPSSSPTDVFGFGPKETSSSGFPSFEEPTKSPSSDIFATSTPKQNSSSGFPVSDFFSPKGSSSGFPSFEDPVKSPSTDIFSVSTPKQNGPENPKKSSNSGFPSTDVFGQTETKKSSNSGFPPTDIFGSSKSGSSSGFPSFTSSAKSLSTDIFVSGETKKPSNSGFPSFEEPEQSLSTEVQPSPKSTDFTPSFSAFTDPTVDFFSSSESKPNSTSTSTSGFPSFEEPMKSPSTDIFAVSTPKQNSASGFPSFGEHTKSPSTDIFGPRETKKTSTSGFPSFDEPEQTVSAEAKPSQKSAEFAPSFPAFSQEAEGQQSSPSDFPSFTEPSQSIPTTDIFSSEPTLKTDFSAEGNLQQPNSTEFTPSFSAFTDQTVDFFTPTEPKTNSASGFPTELMKTSNSFEESPKSSSTEIFSTPVSTVAEQEKPTQQSEFSNIDLFGQQEKQTPSEIPAFDQPKKSHSPDIFGASNSGSSPGFPTFDEPAKSPSTDIFGSMEANKSTLSADIFGVTPTQGSASDFPSTDVFTGPNSKQTSSSGFPEFDELEKSPSADIFNASAEAKKSSTSGFPTFAVPEKSKQGSASGFPSTDIFVPSNSGPSSGFPSFEEPQKSPSTDIFGSGFPSFEEPKKSPSSDIFATSTPKQNSSSGFPVSDFFSPKGSSSGFPSFEESAKSPSTDIFAVSTTQQNGPETPTKSSSSVFPSTDVFGQIETKKSSNSGFPSFEEPEQSLSAEVQPSLKSTDFTPSFSAFTDPTTDFFSSSEPKPASTSGFLSFEEPVKSPSTDIFGSGETKKPSNSGFPSFNVPKTKADSMPSFSPDETSKKSDIFAGSTNPNDIFADSQNPKKSSSVKFYSNSTSSSSMSESKSSCSSIEKTFSLSDDLQKKVSSSSGFPDFSSPSQTGPRPSFSSEFPSVDLFSVPQENLSSNEVLIVPMVDVFTPKDNNNTFRKTKSTNGIEPKGQFPQEPTKSLSTSFAPSTAVDFSPTFPSFDDTTAATTTNTSSLFADFTPAFPSTGGTNSQAKPNDDFSDFSLQPLYPKYEKKHTTLFQPKFSSPSSIDTNEVKSQYSFNQPIEVTTNFIGNILDEFILDQSKNIKELKISCENKGTEIPETLFQSFMASLQ